MYNLQKLIQKIEYDGVKLSVLSYKIGVSRTTLWSRLTGRSMFTPDEIKCLCKALRLNEEERHEIFNINTNDRVLYQSRNKNNRIPKNPQ